MEISYEWDGGDLIIKGGEGRVHHSRKSHIYLGNAGTATRFLASVCALVRGPGYTTLSGSSRMKVRPIGPLVDALRGNGTKIDYLESEGCIPLRIGGDGLLGGEITLSASISSQYVSSILMAAPYAHKPVTLVLVGDAVISRTYIDMTLSMMKKVYYKLLTFASLEWWWKWIPNDRIHTIFRCPRMQIRWNM